jgi:uncharacterized membrane protein
MLPRPSFRIQSLHIITLWAFAVAQPVYDIFAQYPIFFIAHGSRPSDIILLAVCISLCIPCVIAVAAWMLGRINKTAHVVIYNVLITLLAVITVLPLLNKIQILSDALIISFAVLFSIGFTVAYILSTNLKNLISVLSIAALIFPVYFIEFSPVRQLVSQRDITQQSGSQVIGNPVPVVVIIYDEIPLASLMDENRRIDPVHYPNFHQFASDSYWFRNFTVHAPFTEYTVATMLTGRYSIENDVPLTSEAYPETLFTLLGSAGYRAVPIGIVEKLCPDAYWDQTLYHAVPARRRIPVLIADMSMVYLHIILPPGLSAKLPAVDNDWNNFVSLTANNNLSDKLSLEHQFIKSLAPSFKPSLYVLKLHDIHNPWQKLPSGKSYTQDRNMPGYYQYRDRNVKLAGFGAKIWTDNEWLVAQGYQRHLLCVKSADATLGKLIDSLKKLDMYDDALIIVTSDHGCAFHPGQRNRGDKMIVRTDTLPVPFLLKLPRQREAVINDDNVEAVDVLQTIADIMDVTVPWDVEGRSAFDRDTPPRDLKRFYWRGHRFTFDAAGEEKYESLNKKLAIFGSGMSRPNGLFQIGPYGDLVGQSPEDFDLQRSLLEIAFNEKPQFDNVDTNNPVFAPCYISGSVLFSPSTDEPVHIAIGVNGNIEAVTQTYKEETSSHAEFFAIIPEESLKSGKNDITFFEILPAGAYTYKLAVVNVKE